MSTFYPRSISDSIYLVSPRHRYVAIFAVCVRFIIPRPPPLKGRHQGVLMVASAGMHYSIIYAISSNGRRVNRIHTRWGLLWHSEYINKLMYETNSHFRPGVGAKIMYTSLDLLSWTTLQIFATNLLRMAQVDGIDAHASSYLRYAHIRTHSGLLRLHFRVFW